jgi:hypothetical protein
MNATRLFPVSALCTLVVASLCALGGPVHAQDGPALRSVERPIRVAVDPTYQYYETESSQALTELSTHLSASVPIGRRVTVQARASYARMDAEQRVGDEPTAQVRGLTDATGRLMYAQPVGEGSLVMSTRVNIPTGKSKLDDDELRTTRIISQNIYDFRVSSFSRGLTVSPRITYAVPLGDRVAVGIGAGYQYQRGFQPRAGGEEYVPGDGLGVNGGLDYKLTEASALGVDLAFKRFAADQLAGRDSFDAGSRVSGTLRYIVRSGFTTVRAVARYANWEESEFGYRLGDAERGQVIPSHAMLLGSYETRLTDRIDLELRASGHRYAETIQSDQKLFGRASVAPSFELTEQIVVAPHGTATYGSYLGAGGGIRLEGRF